MKFGKSLSFTFTCKLRHVVSLHQYAVSLGSRLQINLDASLSKFFSAHFETKFAGALLVEQVAYQKKHGGEMILYANRRALVGAKA